MRKWILALLCLLCVGCTQTYSTKVTTEQLDGKVTSVKVEMQPGATYYFNSVQELDQFVNAMENTLADLKQIRTQMPVKEPSPPK